jgi:hypothetical protein
VDDQVVKNGTEQPIAESIARIFTMFSNITKQAESITKQVETQNFPAQVTQIIGANESSVEEMQPEEGIIVEEKTKEKPLKQDNIIEEKITDDAKRKKEPDNNVITNDGNKEKMPKTVVRIVQEAATLIKKIGNLVEDPDNTKGTVRSVMDNIEQLTGADAKKAINEGAGFLAEAKRTTKGINDDKNAFWTKHGTKITYGIGVFVILVGALFLYRNKADFHGMFQLTVISIRDVMKEIKQFMEK